MDKDIKFKYKNEHLKKLILNGFIAAMHSHKVLFKSVSKNDDIQMLSAALAYLSEAQTYFINAESLMISNIELFDMPSEFEELFHRFSVFNEEVLNNVRTDHSHQWSDIEFRAFVESFRPVAELLNIDEDNYWINQALSD